ncbi:MAG: peptide chain release factor N(5)-glutamine methyltransferase [Oscillospiraceae bacterium]|nr:peptide chain release factor N(5)-glutamine methyltransferase [Oscillospiraceae bacterium]
MVMTLSELYQKVRRSLMEKEDAESAAFIARQLLCKVTAKTKEQFLADRQMYVSDDAFATAEQLVKRILADEPLAYVLGEWEFYGLTLMVNPSVLIPRDDTCAVTDLAIQQALYLGENPRILDLCTGSGCIGLAIASRVNDAKVTLADISRDALQVARKNISANKLSARVSCVQVNALEEPPAFLGKFDMIVSNPPYITTREMRELPRSVAAFEPRLALHGGDDGVEFYRSIAEKYRSALKPGGYLCFEFGMGQGDTVCALLEENGFTILERSRDYNERERAVLAQYRKEA